MGKLVKKHLIIVSGWAVDEFVWEPICNLLSNEFEIGIVTWNKVQSLDDFKNSVIQLINEKKIEKFSIIGWSLGSLIAFDIGNDYSTRIENMIIFSGTSKFIKDQSTDYEVGWDKKIVNRMILRLNKNAEKTVEEFNRNLFSDREVKNGYYTSFADKTKINASIELLSLGLEYLMTKDMREKIKNINNRVLLIHGEKDLICPVESGAYLVETIKNAQLMNLKETGHIPFYTKTNECYDIIKKYINQKEDHND
ncbi:alpha/beta fold hydrolase [Lutibacter sp. B2]|nr:alpha/beta fold hydrolase [Lutibacter sp. B2]